MARASELIEVLQLARTAVAHPGNDFSWSSWEDATAALKELDGYIDALQSGQSVEPLKLEVLFAATGDLCEVSLSSGWSEGYLRLSERFDAALEKFLSTAES